MIGLIAPLTLLSLLNGNRVDASVNMRSASFQKTWSDNELVSRTYNSRSMYQGLFGFGWCSNLELRITRESPVKLLLEKCGEPVIFKKKNKNSRNYFSENVNERLMDEPHYFVYISPEGAKHSFDKRGRLIRIEDNERVLNVEYDIRSKISSLKATAERVWNVTYDASSQRITGFKTLSGHSWSYEYRDENLIGVNENGAARSIFDYDEVHNMLRFKETNSEVEVITYDLEKILCLSIAAPTVVSRNSHISADRKRAAAKKLQLLRSSAASKSRE
jgi:hypothetical protein